MTGHPPHRRWCPDPSGLHCVTASDPVICVALGRRSGAAIEGDTRIRLPDGPRRISGLDRDTAARGEQQQGGFGVGLGLGLAWAWMSASQETPYHSSLVQTPRRAARGEASSGVGRYAGSFMCSFTCKRVEQVCSGGCLRGARDAVWYSTCLMYRVTTGRESVCCPSISIHFDSIPEARAQVSSWEEGRGKDEDRSRRTRYRHYGDRTIEAGSPV